MSVPMSVEEPGLSVILIGEPSMSGLFVLFPESLISESSTFTSEERFIWNDGLVTSWATSLDSPSVLSVHGRY